MYERAKKDVAALEAASEQPTVQPDFIDKLRDYDNTVQQLCTLISKREGEKPILEDLEILSAFTSDLAESVSKRLVRNTFITHVT